MNEIDKILAKAKSNFKIDKDEALSLADCNNLSDLMVIAGAQGRQEVEEHPDLVEQLLSGVAQEVVRLER